MSDLFDFDQAPPLYGVMGNPIEHSKSPQIHQMFARQFGMRIDYRKILVEPGGFEQAVDNFRASGGRGLNITVPFKLQAWYLCDHLSARARLAEAVNTLWFENKAVHGDNTDGIGLMRDITRNLEFQVVRSRVLIVGAGGAARGILGPLLEAQPAELWIANRTVDKAAQLARHFIDLGPVHPCGLDQPRGQFDLVVNATAAGLQGKELSLPPGLFSGNSLAYDLMYGAGAAAFMQWSAQQGATRQCDGLGMLVEQAAESFNIWHGKQPQTRAVIAALR